MYTILGCGLSGISSSFHLGHKNCILFEKNEYMGGHIYSYEKDGCIWDEGPHVSFTKNNYVKQLFQKNLNDDFLEYNTIVSNYYNTSWIPHPAQSNLYAVPEPDKTLCFNDFLLARKGISDVKILNYEDWLTAAFGKVFYEKFPKVYTEKYWTVPCNELTIDWVGERVFYPEINDVKEGYIGPREKSDHYITNIRYPRYNGFYSFVKKMTDGIIVSLGYELKYISFLNKSILFENGEIHNYDKLISTIPLPVLISKSDAPQNVKEAAHNLKCTSVLLINIVASHLTQQNCHWLYVYNKNYYSTRINFSDRLSVNNAPENTSAIQVEVYFSDNKKMTNSIDDIANAVCEELIEMGLILDKSYIKSKHTKFVSWANVIFDHNRIKSLDLILNWLSKVGLIRNKQDLLPTTNWEKISLNDKAELFLAGRFAEWKYYWSDDCILTGKAIADSATTL